MIHKHRTYETIYIGEDEFSSFDEFIREYEHDHEIEVGSNNDPEFHNHFLNWPTETHEERETAEENGYQWCFACKQWDDDTWCHPDAHGKHCGHPILAWMDNLFFDEEKLRVDVIEYCSEKED